MSRLNQNQRIQTLTMLARGNSFSNVSRVFGCHRNTIIQLCQCFQQTGGVADRRRPRRPRVTNPRTDRFIKLTHFRRCFQMATSSARQYGISKWTVLRRLGQARQPIQPRRPYVGQVLTACHRAARLQWAQWHFLQRHGPVILMNDNASPHVARICRQFLKRNNVNILPWPAVSSDMNPIENIRDYLGRKFRARGNVQNLRDLENALIQEWNDIPNIIIRLYVRSMRGPLAACINSRGGHTQY